MALPETEHHRMLLDRISDAVGELGIGVFWVTSEAVRLDAPWVL
jgi:hypothetical protein